MTMVVMRRWCADHRRHTVCASVAVLYNTCKLLTCRRMCARLDGLQAMLANTSRSSQSYSHRILLSHKQKRSPTQNLRYGLNVCWSMICCKTIAWTIQKVTYGCTADMRNTPSDRRCSLHASPSQRPVSLCYRPHSSPLFRTIWSGQTKKNKKVVKNKCKLSYNLFSIASFFYDL